MPNQQSASNPLTHSSQTKIIIIIIVLMKLNIAFINDVLSKNLRTELSFH